MRPSWLVVPFASLALTACSVGGTDTDGGAAMDSGSIPADAGPGCMSDIDCGDIFSCTIDHCEMGVCVHEPCIDCCPGGLECIVDAGCGAIERCTEDAECRDVVPCTLDVCRDRDRCEHRPQNDLCDAGESCFPALGCIESPPETCVTAEDCTGGDMCLGTWNCEPEFGCQFVAPPECDDSDICTADSCDSSVGMCVHPIVDADDDGYGDDGCGGDDCDDSDPLRNPGEGETCNTVDDDCDGEIDETCCTPGGSCTTTCGTTGVTTCAGGVEGCTATEVCGGGDDDCDTRVDESFDCVFGSAPSACTTTCSTPGTRVCRSDCSFDPMCVAAEVCNGIDDDCVSGPDDTFTCVQGSSVACTTLPGSFTGGAAACLSNCSGYDTSTCMTTGCGNGIVDGTDECDMGDLDGNDCTTVPGSFGSGMLQCFPSCTFNTALCSLCQNGTLNPGEQCDMLDHGGQNCTTVPGGFTGGTLDCNAACNFVTTGCTSWTPSGVYTASPPAVYMCAFASGMYQVNYNLAAFTFTDDGSTLTVTGGRCPMTGPSARITRMINVSCSIPGTCQEDYALTGMFTDDDTWSGTYTSTFFASIPGFCLDCTNQSHPMIGSRI